MSSYVYNTEMGMVSAVSCLKQLSWQQKKLERAFILQFTKVLHIEIHHLLSQSLLDVSLWPLNLLKRIFGSQGRSTLK